jgi:hypothetical protein
VNRIVLSLLLLIALVACGRRASPTPDPTPDPAPEQEAQVDMVVVSGGGTATEETDGNYTITLSEVSPTVVGFVEGGDKITETISTESLATGWSMFFQEGSPTAAMTLLDEEVGASESTIVLSMGEPSYDAAVNSLTFTGAVTAGDVPATFENVSLFIDPSAYQWWELAAKCGTSIVSIIAAAIEEGINPIADIEAANASTECVEYAIEIFGD